MTDDTADGPTVTASHDDADSLLSSRKRRISRRRFLKLLGLGAVGAAAGLTGADRLLNRQTRSGTSHSRQPTGYVTRDDFRFDRTLHAVDDLGMDPNGNNAIDSALDSAFESGTLIQFPPGEYRVERRLLRHGRVERAGIEGLGNGRRDVTFVPGPDGIDGESMWINLQDSQDMLFRNFAVNVTEDDQRHINCAIDCDDGLLMEDIEWMGVIPRDNISTVSHSYTLSVSAARQDGVCTLRRIMMGKHRAAVRPEYPDGASGIRSNASHSGELVLENLHLERLGSSAVAMRAGDGAYTVRGGVFKDNNNNSIRLSSSGHPDKETRCIGATAILESPTQTATLIQNDSSDNTRPVIWEDCDLIHRETGQGGRGVLSLPGFGGGSPAAIMRNCRVLNEADKPTINVDDGGPVTIEDSHFSGSGGDFDAGSGDGTIRNTCIDMPNAEIRGFETENVNRGGNCEQPAEPEDVFGGPVGPTSRSPGETEGNGNYPAGGSGPC
jgi:hypothetical protein